jgi:hypothetical protein
VLLFFQIPACVVVVATGMPIDALFVVVSVTGWVSVVTFVLTYLRGGWMGAARVDAEALARH